MAKMTRLGDLDRAVMDHLWSCREQQNRAPGHEARRLHRDLAYTTIMTVLQRLAKKNLVVATATIGRNGTRPARRDELSRG